MSSALKTEMAIPVTADDLVVLPRLARQIVERLDDEALHPEDMRALIALDPALTTRIIGMAASLRGEIPPTSLDDAIEQLSMAKVIELAGRFSAAAMYVEHTDTFVEELWRHSVTVAHATRALAAKFQGLSASWAFTVGLLHDLGRFAMYRVLATDYMDLYTQALEQRAPVEDFECNSLKIDHALLGAQIAKRLHLPVAISAVIEFHHRPFEASNSVADYVPLIACVSLADKIAHRIGAGYDFRDVDDSLEQPLIEYLGLSDQVMQDLAEEIERSTFEASGFLWK